MKGIPVKTPDEKKNLQKPGVVAIGASAGGLEAFVELLEHLPENTGFVYIFIQHLDPDHESNLATILSRKTKMVVVEAREKMKVKPDHLYIIPPNRDMKLIDGNLSLTLRPSRPKLHLPINSFFTSLAENYQERAIAVLLSGNGTDGTLGMKAIRAGGGVCFAQDASARFQSMPRKATSEDAVDMVLPPAGIADEIVNLSRHQNSYLTALQELNDQAIPDRDENLVMILRLIHSLTGMDFSHYKINTIKRRIIRRMILQKMEGLAEYAQYLKHHTNEVHQLYNDLLINVTSFFRDEELADYLRKQLFPKITSAKSPDDSIRIWIPACSTGQEAYTLAIILMEVLGEKATTTSVQIFATDLSEIAINKARLGIYSNEEVSNVPPKKLEQYFNRVDGSYRIVKSIRDICIFATHNVLKDPPFSRIDLVSCSNLLIYLEPVLQKRLIATFHYALNSSGYLVLSKSETIGNASQLFSQIDKKHKVYSKKKDSSAKAMFEMSYHRVVEEKPAAFKKPERIKSEDIDIDKAVDEVLLKKYTPACVVVNEDLDILQFRGSTGLFLEPTPGRASLNLLKMARSAIGFELRAIVLKSAKTGLPAEKTWVETTEENKSKKLSIESLPIKPETDNIDKYFLVIFREELVAPQETIHTSISKDKRVKQLESELTALREDMRSLIEAQESANEELQSVNEEILSSNEELQSINEELETSKEELESSNEELITVNQELQMRNEQLMEIQEYSEAVFTTIREGLLILDKNFRIKNANACFYKMFRLTEEEIQGKLIYEIDNKQWNIPRLTELLEDVIPRNSQVQDFEVVHHFQKAGDKVLLLNARRLIRKLHAEQLILLAFEDITEFRKSVKILAERENWFRNTAENSPMMIWVTGLNKKIEFVNKAWLHYRETTLDEAIGRSWLEEDVHPEDRKQCKKIFDESFAGHKPFTLEYRLEKDGAYKRILSKGNPRFDNEGKFSGFIGSCVELPELTEV
jgi:two-component system, chemotaxis family, CheB/CheR fusion protein